MSNLYEAIEVLSDQEIKDNMKIEADNVIKHQYLLDMHLKKMCLFKNEWIERELKNKGIECYDDIIINFYSGKERARFEGVRDGRIEHRFYTKKGKPCKNYQLQKLNLASISKA